MLPTVWAHVLVVIFSLCTVSNGFSHPSNLFPSEDVALVPEKFRSVDYKNEARCIDLFKRSYNKHLLRRHRISAETKISPRYLQKCIQYFTDIFDKKEMKLTKFLFKRDADSSKEDIGNKENKESEVKENMFEPDNGLPKEPLPTTLVPLPTGFFPFHTDTGKQKTTLLSPGSTNEDKELESWVFIVIGIAVFLLIAASLTAAFVYHKRKLVRGRQQVCEKLPNAEASSLMYDTQKSGSTDKGTERSRSTVSTYLSKDSREDAEFHELVPLRELSAIKERSSVIELFEDSCYEEIPARWPAYYEPRYPQYEKVINLSSEDLMHRCQSTTTEGQYDGRSRKTERRSTRGFRLQGGNIDFHRRSEKIYNDLSMPKSKYQRQRTGSQEQGSLDKRSTPRSPLQSPDHEGSFESSRFRPAFQFSRNESKSSSSTRSYISIPPTSPSENYVEAGSKDSYLPAEHNTPLTKMTWLTKVWKGDAKNELSTYQASSGTQTDSVSDPNCQTVFGTPWQFGGTFTSRGGVMQAKDSDVCLVVVPGAVPKEEFVDIYGAIFTDTTEIRKKLIFSARESLITPVVEYYAVPAQPFRKPVCVQLPHALPEEFDITLIRVYTFTVDEQGKITLYNVPVFNKANENRDIVTAYWEKGSDGHSIHINTIHFSGYFCTQCETSSWPSICTMVFGSHVQITSSRREVRVILYIWDHRLTIKDYLERFRKQESDVDRQLLTDMQVPLLDSASSNSRLVMCMEVMGTDDDRQSWRHILRPDGSRPLFKPLQVRKLSEIVHCCRQTDPIRVQWALENVPDEIPSTVFQCCIDVMHVHESTRDYETAMREDSDDLMRTFYVRDLKVMTNPLQEPKADADYQRADLKRTLSETMDITQTEKMCHEYGIPIKDIGNFRKKFSTKKEFQLGLLEECLRRHSLDKFVNLLPEILERLNYIQVLTVLNDKKLLVGHLTEFSGLADASKKANEENPGLQSLGNDEGDTRQKSPYRRRSTSPNKRHRSNSPSYRGSKEYLKENQRPNQQQVSGRSGNVFTHDTSHHRYQEQEEQYQTGLGRESRQPTRHRQHSPSRYFTGGNEEYVHNQTSKYQVSSYTDQNNRMHVKTQKSSTSAADSVLGSSSEQSRGTTPTHFSSSSTLGTSMFAHTDPQDFSEPVQEEFLDDYLKQTYQKELMVNKNRHDPYMSEEYHPYLNTGDEQYISDSGLHALPPESNQAILSSVSDPVPPYRKLVGNQRLHEKQQSSDKDQTSKKELFGINTVV